MSYTPTIKEIEDALWDMVSEALGHTRIYFARTNFIKPNQDFVTLRISNLFPLESPGYLLGNGPNDPEESYLTYELTLDVRTYRGPASATAAAIRHAWDKRELWYKHLNVNNIGYLRSSTIGDTSIPLDGETWESRAAFTSIFHVVIKQADTLANGVIETVETIEKVILADGSMLIETDTIPQTPPSDLTTTVANDFHQYIHFDMVGTWE